MSRNSLKLAEWLRDSCIKVGYRAEVCKYCKAKFICDEVMCGSIPAFYTENQLSDRIMSWISF